VMTIRSDRANYQSLFDAANPTAIVEKRIDSTVAPQALFLLNHPFTLDQTKALAERVAKEGPAEEKGKIVWLYRQIYGRAPTAEEIKIGLKAIHQARDVNASSTETNSNELAWEEYCQVLVCANEFIFVD